MDNRRLVILVEGESELMFINQQVIPELYKRTKVAWSIEACKVVTNRQLNKKGGSINYEYLLNDVRRFSAQGCDVITTFLDFFRLPTSFPGYTSDGSQIDTVEEAIRQDVRGKIADLRVFIPYLQKYEFEALLFSSMDGFRYLIDDNGILETIEKIFNQYLNPEDINGGELTAPSKRLLSIFNYNKVADSSEMLAIIGFDTIYSKCPRFSSWFDKLVSVIQ